MVTVSKAVADKVQSRVLDKILCKGSRIVDMIENDKRKQAAFNISLIVCPVLLIVLLCLVQLNRYWKKFGISKIWLINPEEITEISSEDINSANKEQKNRIETMSTSGNSLSSTNIFDSESHLGFFGFQKTTSILAFKFQATAIKQKAILNREFGLNDYNRTTYKLLYTFCCQFQHENLAKLRGFVQNGNTDKHWFEKGIFHVYESMGSKATLHAMLMSNHYRASKNVMFILAIGVSEGMRYLAKNKIIHGQLDTTSCILDANWTVKLTNWAQISIYQAEPTYWNDSENENMVFRKSAILNIQSDEVIKRLLFVHPAILRGSVKKSQINYSHDIYSLGLVLAEIFTGQSPFSEVGNMLGWTNALLSIIDGHRYPACQIVAAPETARDLVLALTTKDWTTKEGVWLALDQSLKMLHAQASKFGHNFGIIDSLLGEMEQYVLELENKMETRTAGLKEMSRKMKRVLDSMMPSTMSSAIQAGRDPLPVVYKRATVAVILYNPLFSNSSSIRIQSNSSAEDIGKNNHENSILLQNLCKISDQLNSIATEFYNSIKTVTTTDSAIYLLCGHDDHLTAANAAIKMLKYLIKVINTTRAGTVEMRFGMASGITHGALIGNVGQRFVLLGPAVNKAYKLSNSTAPWTVHISSSSQKHVQAFANGINTVEITKSDIIETIDIDYDTYIVRVK